MSNIKRGFKFRLVELKPSTDSSRKLSSFAEKCSLSAACQRDPTRPTDHHLLLLCLVCLPSTSILPPPGRSFLGLCFQNGPVLLCLEFRLWPDLDVRMKPDRTQPMPHRESGLWCPVTVNHSQGQAAFRSRMCFFKYIFADICFLCNNYDRKGWEIRLKS